MEKAERGGAPAKAGNQIGDKNAVTHGFYAEVLTERHKMELEEVGEIIGLDAQLALLRVKLGYLLKNNPDRIDLYMKAVNMIARLVRTPRSLNKNDIQGFQDATTKIITEVGIPLGLKIIP